MTKREWMVLLAFVGAVYAASFVSPEGATLLAGVVAVAAFVNSDIAQKVGVA